MIKCSKRKRLRIMSLAMAAALMVNSTISPIAASAQENDPDKIAAPVVEALDEGVFDEESDTGEAAGSGKADVDDGSLDEKETDEPVDSSEEAQMPGDVEVPGDAEVPDDGAVPGDDVDPSGDSEPGNGENESKEDEPSDKTDAGEEGETDAESPEDEITEGDASVEEGSEDEVISDEDALQDEESVQDPGEDERLFASGISNEISWKVYDYGKLIITGTGDYELVNGDTAPWYAYRQYIRDVEIDVVGMTSAKNMFYYCRNLESIDLSRFDTSQLTDTSGMFAVCDELVSLDLSDFDTSQVTNMSNMFAGCIKLTSLNLSGFDTSQVTNMSYMFSDCNQLTGIDLSSFKTDQVTNMCGMFSDCRSLTSLDVSGFKTDQVSDMHSMFSGCSSLTSLDVSVLKTDQVSDMHSMFSGCSSLTSLDVSGFNTSQVQNMGSMFSGCSSLTSLDVSGFKTDQVSDMSSMFSGCSSLTDLDVSGLKTDQVRDTRSMFSGCSSLTSLNVSGFNTSQVQNMGSMFSGCSNLTSLDVSSFNTSQVQNMGLMFSGCSSLTSLDVSSFNTRRVWSMSAMFSDCSSLTSLDLSSFNTSQVSYMDLMFCNCVSLETLVLDNFDKSQVRSIKAMFDGCKSLEDLDLSRFDMSYIKETADVLSNCASLKHISTPKNCKVNIELPVNDDTEIWYCGSNACKTLPLELDYSIDLYRNAYPGDGTIESQLYISGISIKSKEYDSTPCAYEGTMVVKDIEGNLISDISLSYAYQGKLENGTEYAESTQAPSQAGKYTLTVKAENDTYSTQLSYNFNIYKRQMSIIALPVSIEVGEPLPELSGLKYNISDLVKGDKLVTEPQFKYSAENIDTSKLGQYDIIPYGADAGANYDIYYEEGILKVGEVMDESGKVNDISWGVTDEGKLIIEGTGDYGDVAPWTKAKANIYTAVVNVSDITSTKGMFENIDCLTSFDFSNFDTSKVTDMSRMFSGCGSLSSIDLSGLDTSKVTNMSGMFSDCWYLGNLDLSNFNTSNVTDMSGMFSNSPNLENLDLSSFDTSKVTNMSRMFYECYSLKSLDLSNFDTGQVTNMRSMFNECGSLKSLDLSNFDTGKVTDMSDMFCYALVTDLNVSNFITSQVTNMSDMFSNCGAENLDLSSFNTSQVTDMSGMFSDCNLESLDLSKFDTSKVTNMNGMFSYCNVDSLDLSGLDTSQVTDMGSMFNSCSVKSLDLRNFNTSQVTNMRAMFRFCNVESLNLSSFDTSNVTNMREMFYEISLGSLDLSNFDMSKVEDADYMLLSTSLFHIFTPKNCGIEVWLISEYEQQKEWYQDADNSCITLPVGLDESIELYLYENGYTGDIVESGTINNITWEIDKNRNLTITGKGDYISDGVNVPPWVGDSAKVGVSRNIVSAVVDVSGITSTKNMFYNCGRLTSIDLSKLDTSMVTDMSGMFSRCNIDNLDLSNFDTSKVTDMSGMFYCSNGESLNLSNLDMGQVTDMSDMFNNCSIKNLDLSNLNTSKAANMSNMFEDCWELENLNLSGFDTSQVTDMSDMFRNCSGLRGLDLSSFDTSKVTNMSYMFGCDDEYRNSFVNLDLSSFDTSQVTDMSYMFSGCGIYSLDVSSFNTSKVTNMASMFNYCTNLNSLDVSSFDTSNVTNMEAMFCSCRNLVSLDVSSFNTSNVTNMSEMFSMSGWDEAPARSKLVNLNVSNFDTSNVKYMDDMFSRCINVKTLDLSSFDMGKVTSAWGMFWECRELTHIRSPKNCKEEVDLLEYMGDYYIYDLQYMWYQDIGVRCNYLPVGLGYSIDLYRGGYPGDGTMKNKAYLSGLSIQDKVYDGEAYTYGGTLIVKDIDDSVISDIQISCEYDGKLADGSDYAKTKQAPAQAGKYTLTVTAENDMYFGQTSCEFTISPKEMSISAASVSVGTGESLPELSGLAYSTDGLVKDDKLLKEPQFKYSAENIDTSVPGSYEIIPYDADAGNNYSIAYVNGVLNIADMTKKVVTISGITAGDKVYDGEAYAYAGTIAVKDADGNAVVDIPASYEYQGTLAGGGEYAKTEQAPAQAGRYTLIVTVENDKYTGHMLYEFSISPKEISINAESVSIKAGESLPDPSGLKYSIDGLVKDDKLVKEPQLRYSSENIETSVSGKYDIIPYDADAGNNYSIKYVNGVLTIGSSADKPSYGDNEDSSYTDDERTDFTSVNGTIANIKAKTYDGLEYEPAIKVTVTISGKKKTLTEGTDYRVIYEDNLDAGTGTVYVRGNGIYKGEIRQTFKINAKPVKKLKVITGNITGSVNAGDIADNSSDLPVYVYDGRKLLTEGEDYSLSLKNSTDKALTLDITGAADSNYTGTATAKLAVYDGADAAKLINLENVSIEGKGFGEDYEAAYTGKAIKPAVAVKVGDTTLTSKNYKVAYQNNKDAGTAYVIVTGKGEYKGKAVIPFSITSKQSDLQITNVIKDKTYSGKLQKPSVTVKAGGVKLKNNKDYKVTYTDNLHAGTATITVTGKGNYTGTVSKTFKINQQDIKKVSVKGTQKDGLSVTYGTRLLREGSDYTLEYGTQKGKNKIEVTIKAVDDSDFTGSVVKSVKTQ